MSATGDERAARLALERLGGMAAAARHAQLTPMPGGTHARSWLVTYDDGRRHVLRVATRGAPALLDIVTEARAMIAAANAGVAPAVVAIDADRGTLLAEYRAGTPWQGADTRDPQNLARLAALLRTLHAVRVDLPVFAAERVATGYLVRLGAAVRGDARAARWGDELVALARRYDAEYAPTAFCHHDLAGANIIDDGELVLVDFEYAVRGTPLLDLANLAAMNGFDFAERRVLLEAYSGAAPASADLAELDSLVRMVRLMTWFWAALGAARTGDSSPYARYAGELGDDWQRD